MPNQNWSRIKIYCFLFSLIFPFAVSAQFEVGVFAGAQSTTASYKIEDIKQSTQNKYGLQAGVILKIPFEAKLFFVPELFYNTRGYKVSFTKKSTPPDSNAVDNNTTIHCVEIATFLQVDLGNKPSHLFIKVGPSFDVRITGKETFNKTNGDRVSRKMTFSFASDYGVIGANIIGQLGFESKSGFFVFGTYTLGLASTVNQDRGPKIIDRAAGISFGMYLNRKKIVLNTKNKE